MRATGSLAAVEHSMPSTGKKVEINSVSRWMPSVQDISHAYLYLLARLIVLRQEYVDFKQHRAQWNTVVHRKPGEAAWGIPNLDVAYSDAWIAVDKYACTLIELPPIVDRYYTMQIVDSWGETIVNINPRTHPSHPSGSFLICPSGARVTLPTDSRTERIDLPGKKARVLIGIQHRPELGDIEAIQRQIRVRPTAASRIVEPVSIPFFSTELPPAVEVFDSALAVLDSEPDTNPRSDVVQRKVRAVAAAATGGPSARHRIDTVIRRYLWVALKKHATSMRLLANGWSRLRRAGSYGDDWLMRTIANLAQPWINDQSEEMHFESGVGHLLHGSHCYTLTFPKSDAPGSHVKYFWSLTCVHGVTQRVVPNEANRHVVNSYGPLETSPDGSLTLYLAPHKPIDAPDANWLPTPEGEPFALVWRSYGPDQATIDGEWFPPPLKRAFHRRARRLDMDDETSE